MDMEPNMQPRPNGGYQQQTSAPQPENPQQGWSQPPIRNRQTGAPQGWTPRPENPQQGWSQPLMGNRQTGAPQGWAPRLENPEQDWAFQGALQEQHMPQKFCKFCGGRIDLCPLRTSGGGT